MSWRARGRIEDKEEWKLKLISLVASACVSHVLGSTCWVVWSGSRSALRLRARIGLRKF
jgi:hypothetical protein